MPLNAPRKRLGPPDGTMPPTTQHRPDGWPLCPRCGEDELYADAMLKWNPPAGQPTLRECYDSEFHCYVCRWQGFLTPPAGLPDSGGK